MAVAQQQQRYGGATRSVSEVEGILRHKSSWENLATRLLLMCLGIFMALYGALDPSVTATDRTALWAMACFAVLSGAALLCWDAYLRRKLRQALAEMQSAVALESAGQ